MRAGVSAGGAITSRPGRPPASSSPRCARRPIREDASALTPAQREAAAPPFALRDEIITLLARSDPASADRLSDLYVAHRKLAGERGGS